MQRRGPPAEQQPEFFTDRSLGRHVVPDALRAVGLTVHTMGEIYPETEQLVPDVEWIPEVAARGWIILMKDDKVRMKPAERNAVIEANAKAFVVTNAQLPGVELAARFVANRHRIIQASRRPGPFIYGVYSNRLERLFPRA